MAATDPTSARTEAERLVATALAAVRLGAFGRVGGFGPLGDLISGVLDHIGDAPSARSRSSRSSSATSGPSMSSPTGAESATSAAESATSAAGPATSAAGSASGTPGRGGFATGAAECGVCPICRTIAALRDPSPEFAERLATGAGDFAAGLASLLRALSTAPGPASTPADAPAGGTPDYPAPPSGRPSPDDEVWRGATRTGHDSWPAPERDVWAAATRAPTETRSDRAAPPADPGDGA